MFTISIFAVCMGCGPCIYTKYTTLRGLEQRIAQLRSEKASLQEEAQTLKEQVANCSDFAWVEMLLMEKLGVVAEGQKKVYFSPE